MRDNQPSFAIKGFVCTDAGKADEAAFATTAVASGTEKHPIFHSFS